MTPVEVVRVKNINFATTTVLDMPGIQILNNVGKVCSDKAPLY